MNIKCRLLGHKWKTTRIDEYKTHYVSKVECERCRDNKLERYQLFKYKK